MSHLSEPSLLTVDEAARVLRLSVRTLERLRLSGDGPRYAKLGKRVLYPSNELGVWIASKVTTSTSASA